MDEKITITYASLAMLQLKLVKSATSLSEVANGAYVTQDMFPESTGETAYEMNRINQVLAASATAMWDLYMHTASRFGEWIEKFTMADLKMAQQAYATHLAPGPQSTSRSKWCNQMIEAMEMR